jgi:hypothetical protein
MRPSLVANYSKGASHSLQISDIILISEMGSGISSNLSFNRLKKKERDIYVYKIRVISPLGGT